MLNDITNVARSETMEYGRWTVYWTGIFPTAEYSIFIGILQYITRSFKNVADIKVTNKKDATFIYFKDAGIVTRVAYNKNGNWLHTMRSLLTEQIPARVSELVQEEFPRHKINGANEIHALDKIAHLVYIEDAKGFKTIRVVDGEWDVYEEFNK